MSAELPQFAKKLTRREFLIWGGTAATIFLSGCQNPPENQPPLGLEPESFRKGSPSFEKPPVIPPEEKPSSPAAQEVFPIRTKLPEIIPWRDEPEGQATPYEIEKGRYLFGEAVGKFSDGRLWVEEFLTGRIKEIDLPTTIKEMAASGGPGILINLS